MARQRPAGVVQVSGELRPYQADGVEFLVGSASALLADEMGLGKTVQVAVALDKVLRRSPTSRALVIAPASLRINWIRELHAWAPKLSTRLLGGVDRERRILYYLPVNVLVASYDQIRADFRMLPSNVAFDVVVIDEAQRIKNRHTLVSLGVRSLRRSASWALSGTPLENRRDELLAVMDFVRPRLLHETMSTPQLHSAMRPHFIRRRKHEVLGELPPLIDQTVEIELTPRQSRAYSATLDRDRRRLGDEPDAAFILALITRLKKLANRDPTSGESAKLDALRLIVESSPSGKLLVFSQYVETLKWLQQELKPPSSWLLTGSMSEQARADAVSDFQRAAGGAVLFGSLLAAGVGLNLQSATHVVLFDRWWNPALEQQAVARAHRFGRDQPLHVLRFVAVGTIEEDILALLNEKRDLFAEIVDDAPNARVDRDRLLQIYRSLSAGATLS